MTIKNCHVTSFSNNFVLLDSSDNTLKWNTSTANTSVAGFWLKGTSSNNTLKNNTANGGVKFGTSNGFVVQASASGNILTHNTANGNAFRGISIVGSGNIIRNNTANGNFTAGFLMFGGSGNTFTANTATNNDSEGFAILSASGNTFTGNVANDNGTLHSSSGSSWPVPLETPSRGTRPTEMTPSATWTFRRVLVRRERPTPIVGTCVKGTKSEAQARPGCASHNRKLPVVRTSTEMGRGLGRAAQLAAISWHRPGAGNGVGGRKQRVGPQFKMMLEETLEGEARL